MQRGGKSVGVALAALGLLTLPPSAQAKAVKTKAVSAAGGDWSGALNAGGTPLRLVLHFTKQPGGLAGTLDSPDQGAHGIPFSLVRQTGSQVHAEVSALKAAFDGKLDASGKRITGQWQQGTNALPLALTRMTTADKAGLQRNDRPQEPKPPYPYTADDVTFPGGAGGVTLAGTLTLPSPAAGAGPFPAALLISGSGPNERDETILRHKLFLVLADSLTRRGIAVLRYDKRGIGRSTGSYAQATSRDFADDAGAAFAYLKTRPEVNARKIGLIGHSEGGLLAPMVAVKSPDVAFLVLLAGPGVRGERIIAEQAALIDRIQGIRAADVAKNQVLEAKVLSIAAHEPDAAVARVKIQALMRQALATMTPTQRKEIGDPEPYIQAQSAAATSPWFRFFLTYDPAPTLQQVHCPVLALGGSRDLQVPPAESLATIAAALKAGGNADVTTTELPGLNHLFQTAKTGSPVDYGRIEETMARVALTTVGDWIVAREK